jgi:predicted RNA-binding protein YlqC (UPF0109 family)
VLSPVGEELRRLMALLVDRPESLRVEEFRSGSTADFEARVDGEDLGKVIGRRGRTVDSLRALLAARGERQGERYELEVAED